MCHGLLLSYTFSFKVLVRMQIPHCVLFQITESLASGAKKVCFQQFASAKDFPTFVSDFWSLGKRDQDTLVPHSIFNQIFVWLKKTCFKRVQIYLRVLRQKGNQPVLPQNIWLHVFVAQMLYQLSCIYLHRDLAPQYLGAFWKNQLEQNASHHCLVSGRPAFAKVLGAHLTWGMGQKNIDPDQAHGPLMVFCKSLMIP